MYKTFHVLILSFLFSLNASASGPLEVLEPKLKEFSVVTSTQIGLNLAGQDVHLFNVKIKPYADLVNQCNELALLNCQHDPLHVIDFLSAMRLEHGFAEEFETELAKIRAYLKSGLDYDNETNMRVSHMLSALRNFFDVAHFQNPKAILSEIFFYLKQNTVEQGGCFPGYAGRLMLINGLFILEIREILHIWPEYLEEIKNCQDCSKSSSMVK